MRALPAILVIALLIALTVIIADQPGHVALAWGHWRIDTSIAVLLFGVVIVAMLSALLFHLLRRLLGAPRALRRARHEKRRRNGYRALTQGMVAVAAGDPQEAQRLARQADVLLAEPPLTLLLSAQAAQLNGDQQAAERYFNAMLERPETEFLGLRGLIMQAQRQGDEATALRHATRARQLRPRTPWVLASLFELQARAGHWDAAEATLGEAKRQRALPDAASQHRRAVVLHERSRAAEEQGQPRDALRLAAKAHGAEPGFAPAAARYAGLLNGAGHRRQARRTLEAAWKLGPHPLLAEAYGGLFAAERPLTRVKVFERLAAQNPEHPESRLALAEAALKARLWGEARRQLTAAGASPDTAAPAPRLARLMAELEEAEHDDQAAARAWLARAAATQGEEPAYLCGACGGETTAWTAICPHCRAFDSIAWRRRPGGPLPMLSPVAAETGLSPALPVPMPWTPAIDAAAPRR